MKYLYSLSACVSIFISLITHAHATDYISLGAGVFDVDNGNARSTEFVGEWRGNLLFYNLLPVVGATANSDGGIYGFVGLNYDWEFIPQWILTPSLAAGLWDRDSSAHLGGTIEFREGLEADYRFDNDYRVGARFSHTSNASLYDHNPGEESLVGIFSVPVGN